MNEAQAPGTRGLEVKLCNVFMRCRKISLNQD